MLAVTSSPACITRQATLHRVRDIVGVRSMLGRCSPLSVVRHAGLFFFVGALEMGGHFVLVRV